MEQTCHQVCGSSDEQFYRNTDEAVQQDWTKTLKSFFKTKWAQLRDTE